MQDNHIPPALRIEIVYEDDVILVVNKPCNLRSVPGHADPPPTTTGKRKERGSDDDDTTTTTSGNAPQPKMTAQEAWVQALGQLAAQESTDDQTQSTSQEQLQTWLQRLAGQFSQRASIPRRYAAFTRYLQRSRKRVFDDDDDDTMDDAQFTATARQIFQAIERVQQDILKHRTPTPTADQDSVVGQLKLLGKAQRTDSRAAQDLFVVHRLDCQTSGLLVLARTAAAASFLSACWRSRQQVTKVYRAWVDDWIADSGQGDICLPMSPHPTERLKWVVNHGDQGKECITQWQVLEHRHNQEGDKDGVVLELKPITGRTHQLRVHCAATASPIRGDSLYGSSRSITAEAPTTTPSSHEDATATNTDDILCLHAEKLSFPHPTTKQVVTFQVPPRW
eukprot:scaffold1353_cov161-Amphora_coffeaeformis.AAC.23